MTCDIAYSGMRLVVDTAVMVAAIRSDSGASRHLLVAGLEARFTMLASVPLLIEYQAVMSRREHLAASGLSAADVEALLDAAAAVAEPVLLNFLWRPVSPDPDDDMVLETGVNGRANAIATFNRRHFVMVTKQFGLDVLSPVDAVKRLEKGS
jgi:predicted nucleic acid-binding protein